VQRAQFDLSEVRASGIDFFSDQARALQAVARLAWRDAAAAMDANGRRRVVRSC